MTKLVASAITVKDLISSGADHEEGEEKCVRVHPYISMKFTGMHHRVILKLFDIEYFNT